MLWLIALCALLLALMGALAWLAYARRSSAAEHEAELAHWQRVAEEVGGLTLSQTSTGRPRLRGNVAGIEIEVDGDNHFDRGFEGLLGLRA
ncbi:MAG: hypothetical protein K8H88_14830, partial [Sandaracinaceae bacterium]|nr:hypothetical protein [Sandaracinaceae bacterium]